MFFRYRVFTHRKVQLRLATVFALWVLVFCALLAGLFFMNYDMLSQQTEGMRIHDELVTKKLLIDQASQLALMFGGVTVGFAILIWLYLAVYTHRLTGPIYKMELELKKCIHNKDFPERPIKFRSSDAFHEFADLFNEFVEVIRNKK